MDVILANSPCISTITRSCKISQVFSLKALKKTAKTHDASINDLFLAAINKSVHDFAKAKGKPQGDIAVSCPASDHKHDKDLSRFSPSNEIVGALLKMKP